MSYPSIYTHLEEQGVTPETATDDQLRIAFMKAFRQDLPFGLARVRELVNKLYHSDGDRVMLSLDPTSLEGQQYARLLGPDVPRKVLEDHYGDVMFGFYNCCKGVAAADKTKLGMTMREQIEVQHPNFVDC